MANSSSSSASTAIAERRTLAFALLVAATLAAPRAHAQDSRADYLRLFDRNGDGRVSETEYVAYMSAGFERMDRDGNGRIEGDELPGGHGRPISLDEYRSNLRRQFRRLDRNHDGVLDARELTAPPR